MTIQNVLKQIKNTLFSVKREVISQKTFLINFQAQFGVKKPIWCNSEDTFAVRDESLLNAKDLTVEHAIGRYRLTLENSNVQEIWIDCDNHDNIPFKEFKEQRLIPSFKHLLNLGIPSNCIYPKVSGTGIHLHVFIEGLPANFDPAEFLMKATTQEACERSRVQKTKVREFGASTSTGKGYTTYISDLSKLKSIPVSDTANYPNIKAFKATKEFMMQLSFIEMDNKQANNEKDEFVDYERDGDFNQLFKCPLIANLAEKSKVNHHLLHNERLFLMSQFIHFGESSRNKMHQIISTCNDYDQGYTNQMMHHAMQHNYHPFTCKWAHDMRLECPTDCAGSGGKSPIKFAWTPLELSEIKLEYRKLILLAPEDDEIIEIALSQILDPMFDGELAWMFLIAPPSWAKTVILVSIHDPKWTELLDSITDKTFFTGKTKVDPKTKEDIPIEGLLPKLNRRTLLIKEFTTILMSGEEQRKSIFGQMRAIYDCHYSQAFGSFDYAKVPETWKHIRMGFFAGCTPYIDKYSVLNAALGERYLKIRMKEPDRLAAIRYARLSSQDKEQKAKQLQKKVKRFIANLKIPERFEQPPDDIANALDYLSEFTVQVRAPVEKEIFAYGNINYEYPDNKELGTRLVQQLVRKGWALTVVCGTDFNEHIYSLLFRIALDTLLPSRKEMVLFLYKRKDAVDDGYIRKTLEWGYKRVENTLTELKHIRVVDNEENSGLYSLNPYIRMCLDKSLLPLHGVHNSLHGGVSPHSLNTYNNKNMRSSSESSELHGKINSDKPFPAKISDNWLSKNQEDVPSCAESS